jgi:hypothetical protein
MLTVFREGGFPMFFLLAFGLLNLIFAARYALAPTTRGLGTTLGLGLATVFTTLTCVFAALAEVGHHAPDYQRAHPGTSFAEVLAQGAAESMSPAIFGFTLLSLAALLVALGLHRQPGVAQG